MKVCNRMKFFATAIVMICIISAGICIKMVIVPKNNDTVKIMSDGKTVYEFNLKEHNGETIDIPSSDGGKNTVEIKDGTVFIAEATCPDKLCIKQGKRGEGCMNAAPIVCLPNKLYISVGGGN